MVAGGDHSSGTTPNVIQYFTIASAGNSSDFGDLSQKRKNFASFSNNTYGFWAGGDPNGTIVTLIDKVTISSTGNATEYADLLVARENCSGCSNSHGGL